jgi:hypothetical protein
MNYAGMSLSGGGLTTAVFVLCGSICSAQTGGVNVAKSASAESEIVVTALRMRIAVFLYVGCPFSCSDT